MNVANVQLSKQLYDLSGWSDTDFCWDDIPVPSYWPLEMRGRELPGTPAYDLGYLLRKLLPDTQIEFILQSDGKTLLLYYPEPLEETHLFADTPEDAACKLAIELFKQGLLQREAA